MSRTSRSDAEVTLISSENFILFTPMPFRPESEKEVIGLLRSIWRRGESTARINSKAEPIKRGIPRKAMLEERP